MQLVKFNAPEGAVVSTITSKSTGKALGSRILFKGDTDGDAGGSASALNKQLKAQFPKLTVKERKEKVNAILTGRQSKGVVFSTTLVAELAVHGYVFRSADVKGKGAAMTFDRVVAEVPKAEAVKAEVAASMTREELLAELAKRDAAN